MGHYRMVSRIYSSRGRRQRGKYNKEEKKNKRWDNPTTAQSNHIGAEKT
jgi:hypothetical protein